MFPCDTVSGCFYAQGKPLASGPVWGMSLRKAGSMRFRWNEENALRNSFLKTLAAPNHEIAAVELIHSHTVYAAEGSDDCYGRQGDGIITRNKNLIPVVTAADCLPIFLYNPQAEVFGALHSGWRGTGIVKNALERAAERYGARAEDFCVVLAPHIHSCCYTVDKERADYFAEAFGEDCVIREDGSTFRLSLAAANFHVLKDCGLIEENIYVSPRCTCCNSVFGSFRREHAAFGGSFTVQAAWVKWEAKVT